VVYLADQDTNNVNELYSVPIGGGSSVKLNGTLVAGGDVRTDFRISADSAHVVYAADQDTDNVFELYSVPIDRSDDPIKLNDVLVTNGNVSGFLISPDGATVVYDADRDTDGVLELYGVPVSGGMVYELNGPFVAGGSLRDEGPDRYSISSDSSRVLYIADQETDGVFELYRAARHGHDRDADGVGASCDCDNENDQIWATPGEVQGVMFLGDKETLIWDPPAEPGAASVVYDTLRSDDPQDFTAGGTCVEQDDGTDTSATVAGTAPAGTVRHYLVRAQNGCEVGEGSLGSDSFGEERDGRPCP
jgi:hypothetical protein